jgi:hypothetical protein
MTVMVEQVLQYDTWDRLVVMEHDMLPDPDVFLRIAKLHNEDIVGAMYFGHRPPHEAHALIEKPGSPDEYESISPQTVAAYCKEPGLYEVATVAMGLTSIARNVLENWDTSLPMFEDDGSIPQAKSHDLWFCHQARRQGYRVFVDSGIVCEHLTEISIGYEHNQGI